LSGKSKYTAPFDLVITNFPFVKYSTKWIKGFSFSGLYREVYHKQKHDNQRFENLGCRTVEDFDDWTKWLFYKGGVGVKTDNSWEAWWLEEQVSRLNHNMDS
jgi:hypothetical protein